MAGAKGAYVEPDWRDWRGLLAPWPEGAAAIAALEAADVFGRLEPFGPLLIGTFPLGLAVVGSDLDIACHLPDPAASRQSIRAAFGAETGLRDRLFTLGGQPTLVLGFEAGGHAIEIFGQPVPPRDQFGHRHLRAEHFLLWRHGEPLRLAVRALKRQGMKTEPAFAAALGLPAGDPYVQLLEHATTMAQGLHF
ncbi:DUF4269 domain-containing protein [Roseomonas terrae]|uniref:DUF4269 domain-containing protein n=1 Tax=Neoroseomonas terrae TaxID=424799 RepID=A0ABS5EID4_9PROT|nr:DUF4269 domain-containing protein [Neoroseomonas terrae]